MNVTGIEVIRRGTGMAVAVAPGERVELDTGDTLRLQVGFVYRGPAQTVTLHGMIGVRGINWLTKASGDAGVVLEDTAGEFAPCSAYVDIDTFGMSPETGCDLRAEISEYRDTVNFEIPDVIDIAGIPPQYELVQHTVYPLGYVYQGEVEVCAFEFKLGPEQIPGTEWLGKKIADAFAGQVEGEGSRMMDLKVYSDASPTFWTDFHVEATAAVAPEEGVGIWPVLAALPWGLIIKGALGLLGLWLVTHLIKSVDRLIHKPPPLTDEEIDKMSREGLIECILYKKPEEWDRETLEGMSDDDLRSLLKVIVKGEGGISWGTVAVIGAGVVVVGVAALALAGRQSED